MKKLTIGIIAHVDSGKTTLSEAMLYLSGAIRTFGRVDKQESFLDNASLERRRGITIFSKQARFSFGNTSFVLIDTPGHADFSAETERALQVLDCCVLVISAKDGVTGRTKTLWGLLAEYNIPTFIFVNKMDQEGADKVLLLRDVRKLSADAAVDFSDLKFNSADDCTQDALSSEAYEEIAMCEEAAMEEYLGTGKVNDDAIGKLISQRRLFPCFFGSALHMDGISALLGAMDRYMEEPVYPEEFSARVYKIYREEDGTRLTFLKVTGGSLKNRSQLPDGEGESKINQIRFYSGEKYSTQESAQAGDICAVAGLKESFAGQGFGLSAGQTMPLLIPVLSYRVQPQPGMDPAKILPYFRTIEEESPELSVIWEESKKEIYVNVMGPVQLEILTSLVQERFGITVRFDSGDVVYKETIAAPVIGVGHFEPLRHYAEVHLLMEPLERGSGLIFQSAVSSDRLATNWQRLILTHLAEKKHRGVLTGSYITDIRFTLTAGKAHLKHTEGGDFRQAVYRAVRQGLMMTENVLLEPFYRFVLEVPTEAIGRALSDLDRMQASFQAPQPDIEKGMSAINGRGPVAALKDYPAELASYTRGTGNIRFITDGYGPCHNAEEVIEKKAYDPLRDVRNPADSVFCSHGAGHIVPYDEVYDYMHLSFDGTDNTADSASEPGMSRRVSDRPLGTEEVDAIIAGISHANTAKKGPGSSWKKKYGTKDASVKVYGETEISRKGAGKAQMFSPEEADYLLADGYNIIFAHAELSALAKENIDAARDALIGLVSKYQSMVRSEVIIVFDAYRVKGRVRENTILQDVRIVYTKENETADQYIERFANEHAKKAKITVVTSDHTEQIVAGAQGCRLISSREFINQIQDLSDRLNDKYNVKNTGRNNSISPSTRL